MRDSVKMPLNAGTFIVLLRKTGTFEEKVLARLAYRSAKNHKFNGRRIDNEYKT